MAKSQPQLRTTPTEAVTTAADVGQLYLYAEVKLTASPGLDDGPSPLVKGHDGSNQWLANGGTLQTAAEGSCLCQNGML